jgi:peptidoglycan hydrolase-like protein with peptidoglycan-binding domain
VAGGHGGTGFVAVRYLTSNNTANLTATDTITSTGVVGKVIGATLAATVAITAAGVVGKSSGATISETATISAAGDALAANEGSAALAATDTITATGVVGRSTGASLAATGAVTATGATGVARAAAIAATGTITAAGSVFSGASAGATISATVTFTAAGIVTTFDIGTDTSNRDDGVFLDGTATVSWEPAVVEPPFFVGPLTEDQVRIAARCIDTAPGALPSYTTAVARQVYAPAARDRVLIDGIDFTYWNDAAAQVENMKLIDPLLYGGARITLPGINPQFPDAELGDLVTRFRFARVKIQRVLDGEVIATDSKGFVSRVDTTGTTLSLEVGGQAAGALSQMYVPPAVFRRKQDVEHICADLLRDARVQAKEHDGTSGVGLIKRGGSDGLTIFNETVAVWAGATGQAVTWTPNADGVYRKTQKSDTIVATAYIDSSLVSQSLAQDFMEQYTRVYARGFTANGEIVTNIKTPGLDQGDAPNFPLASGTLSVGMDDDDTTSGAGVTAAQQQLAIHNFLDFEDTTPGTFDALTERAVEAFQEVAGLNVTGEIGENTWDALWNLEAIGYSLDEAREYPMSQDVRTFKWYRTANGSKFRENPDYDPHFIPNDVAIDVGGPFGRGEIHDYADSKRAPDAGVWTGTLTFRSGLIWGNHSPGDPLVADDVMDRRDLLPNMRIKLPYFAGGISVYVAGVDHGPDETTCLVSEVPQTTMEVWQAIERRREAKSNPGRAWSGHTRTSQVRNDTAPQWDTRGGRIATKRALVEGWNEIMVPVGQAGIVQSVLMQLEDADEFAALLTQKPTSITALNDRIDPLAAPPADPQRHTITISGSPTGGTFTLSGNSNTTSALAHNASAAAVQTAVRALGGAFAGSTVLKSRAFVYVVTMPSTLDLDAGTNSLTGGSSPSMSVTTSGPSAGDGRPWWEHESILDWLEDRLYLDAWGTEKQPCGYDPSRKTDENGPTAQPITGLMVETAGFNYETGAEPVLYLYIWVGSANHLMPGRILKNQRTTDF